MAPNFGFPNYGYNPMSTFMPQPAMQQTAQQPMQSGIMCRPVSSMEEAKGMQVQFDGSLYAFINLNAGEIYTKQFNFNTGSTDFEVYTKALPAPPVVYATQSDIEEIRKELAKLRRSKKEEVNNEE